jgi:TPR repeat protein
MKQVTSPELPLVQDELAEVKVGLFKGMLLAATETNEAKFQHQVARMYGEGEGVPQNLKNSQAWYKLAAHQGLQSSQFNLGTIYEEATGCVMSYEKAYYWYQKAAQNNDPEAHEILAEFDAKLLQAEDDSDVSTVRINGQDFESLGPAVLELTSKLEDNETSSLLAYVKSSADFKGAVTKAKIRAKKEGVALSLSHIADCVEWTSGYRFLAGLYGWIEETSVIPKTPTFKQAERFYAEGKLQDAYKAFLRLADEEDHAEAQRYLSDMFYSGTGIEQDHDKARDWCMKAAIQGHTNSQFTVAEFFRVGACGCLRSFDKAHHWYRQAYESGNDKEAFRLMAAIEESISDGNGNGPIFRVNGYEFNDVTPAARECLRDFEGYDEAALLTFLNWKGHFQEAFEIAKKEADEQGSDFTLKHLTDAVEWAFGYQLLDAIYEWMRRQVPNAGIGVPDEPVVLKDTVMVRIVGPGCRVSAYEIDQKILKKLRSATPSDAVYEDNPLSIVSNIAKRSYRVCEGMSIQESELEARLGRNDVWTSMKIGLLPDGCTFEETFTGLREGYLLAHEKNVEPLGCNEIPTKASMFVLEVEEYKMAQLSATLNVDEDFDSGDIELLAVDMDVPHLLSEITYGLGVLNGVEQDIRRVKYRGQTEDFELDILNGYASRFYLVKKDKDGAWTLIDL